jgi:transcriptional regulator with XRE-family HTH domain
LWYYNSTAINKEVERKVNISVTRKKAGVTQGELAEKLGVTQGAVSQWENGDTKPSVELLPKLASVLGCTIDDLFRKDEAN